MSMRSAALPEKRLLSEGILRTRGALAGARLQRAGLYREIPLAAWFHFLIRPVSETLRQSDFQKAPKTPLRVVSRQKRTMKVFNGGPGSCSVDIATLFSVRQAFTHPL